MEHGGGRTKDRQRRNRAPRPRKKTQDRLALCRDEGRKMTLRYHVCTRGKIKTLPLFVEEELTQHPITLEDYYDTTETDWTIEQRVLMWQEKLKDEIYRPPAPNEWCILFRCEYTSCTGDYDLTLPDRYTLMIPRKVDMGRVHDRTQVYHFAVTSKKGDAFDYEEFHKTWPSAADRMITVQPVYRITIFACTESQCRGIGAHIKTEFSNLELSKMRKRLDAFGV
jgi:hypothetical protein